MARAPPTWTSGSNFEDKSDQLYLFNSFTKKKVNFRQSFNEFLINYRF
jgi:hypothetical protein